jgi:MtN3 and saliva related transmembrane protein
MAPVIAPMQAAELIGWMSSAVLLATISRQVFTEWKTQSTDGVSKWLFLGQVAASTGSAVYRLLLHNWVYVVSNVALLITAVGGQIIYKRNQRASELKRQQAASCPRKNIGA